VSLGGVYTSLQVPELSAVFDVGMALRSFAASRTLFLSHAHVDHLGALPALLGMRALVGKTRPIKAFMPMEIVDDVKEVLSTWTRLQRYDLSVEAVGMSPGDEHQLQKDVWVQAFRTHHPVPSLGYQLFRRTRKLFPQFQKLPGAEIGRLRRAGTEGMFREKIHRELAYATDTLVEVLDHEPALYDSKVLILECTFLDERKNRKDSRAGCHIHLDELLERAHLFKNEALVLMHFSQIYKPSEVVEILRAKCPPELFARIIPFVPEAQWPG